MTYRLYSFNGVQLPTIRAEADIGPGPAQDRTFELPSGDAFDPWGTGDAPKAQTVLRHRGRIWNSTLATLENDYNELVALIGEMGKLNRQLDSDSRFHSVDARCVDVRCVRRGENRLADGGLWMELEFAFRMLEQYWDGWRRGSGWSLDTGEVLDDGLLLDDPGDQVMTASPYTGTWHNGGNKDATDAVITVSAVGTNITALTVQRMYHGSAVEDWDYSGTITAGQSVEVDCGAWSVENNGSDDWANFAFDTANHTTENILTLKPGDNSIKVTFTGGGAASTINITFHDKMA